MQAAVDAHQHWWTPIRQASTHSWAAWPPNWPPSSPTVHLPGLRLAEHPAPARPGGCGLGQMSPAWRSSATRRRRARAPGRGVVAARPGKGGPDRGGRWPADGGAGTEAKTLARAIAVGERSAADAGRLADELAKAWAELEASAADLRDAAAGRPRPASRPPTRAALGALRADLASAAQGHPSVAARQSALIEAATRDRAVAAALDKLSAALASQGKAHQQADREAGAAVRLAGQARKAVVEPAGRRLLPPK